MPFFYNDQFTGSNGWPNTGRSIQGDTNYATWATDGTVYMIWNDGFGPSNSGGAAGGHSANVGFATLSSDLKTATFASNLSSMGTSAQTNTGGWTDGATWKTGGVMYINDGRTDTGIYLPVNRQLDSPPWTVSNTSIMKSTDGGVTWCNPAGTCSTNGAAPAANTAEFTTVHQLQFAQYEQGGSGTLTVDCQNNYIYATGTTGGYTAMYLIRAARGSNLQSAASWQYYSGALGGDACNAANWTSTFASATVMLDTSHGPTYGGSIVYVSGFGYIRAQTDDSGNGLFYRSQSITGPWVLTYTDPVNTGNRYAFIQPLLHTLAPDGSGGYTMWTIFDGSYLRDTGTGSTPYSPFFRLMTITP